MQLCHGDGYRPYARGNLQLSLVIKITQAGASGDPSYGHKCAAKVAAAFVTPFVLFPPCLARKSRVNMLDSDMTADAALPR